MPDVASTRERARGLQPMQLSSSAFRNGERMPARHTADGPDLSPPLAWSRPPPGTKSLALVCADPDAPSGTFVHWLAWNIDPSRSELPEGVDATSRVAGICQGQNGLGTHGYAGPNPPPGSAHRYGFHLYALDTELTLDASITRADLDEAIAGHVLGQGDLIGKYGR